MGRFGEGVERALERCVALLCARVGRASRVWALPRCNGGAAECPFRSTQSQALTVWDGEDWVCDPEDTAIPEDTCRSGVEEPRASGQVGGVCEEVTGEGGESWLVFLLLINEIVIELPDGHRVRIEPEDCSWLFEVVGEELDCQSQACERAQQSRAGDSLFVHG